MPNNPDGVGDGQVSVAFPTVGIGASAGGLKALQAFFDAVSPDLGAAYVVIVHLDPEHQSELASILANRTTMPVAQVVRKVRLEPNHVYVIPPNRRLLISDHEIATFAFDEPRGHRAPIDQFFRSLADQHGDGFGIVLSGAGADGSAGLKAIKEGGGIVMVQEPSEAEYPSMPRNAIATGHVDFVLPVSKIAEQIAELMKTKQHMPQAELVETEEETFRRILALLRTKTGHDFSLYKRSTVLRRLSRRMQVCGVEKLEDYYALLRGKPEEAQNLFNDLLISVTMFFRDPHAFEALDKEVIPKLFEAAADTPIRIWVPGCATGEEAYSLGMLFIEHAAGREERPPIQIFASDLDVSALSTAREGRYPASIASDVSEERLRRFFTKEGEHYRVNRELRDIVLFSGHSLLKDPPFSRLDLISCRNLMIYLDRELQHQVCITFSYALKPGGYLLLGSSETAEHPAGLFRPINREARIFQSAAQYGDPVRQLPRLALAPRLLEVPATVAIDPSKSVSRHNAHIKALEQLGPPSILVDRALRILHISENAGRYLQPSAGQLSSDVTEMARPELRFDLKAYLHKAFESGSSEFSLPIPVQFNGTPVKVYMLIRPVANVTQEPQQAVVFFIEGGAFASEAAAVPDEVEDASASQRIRALQEELELTRSRLRTSNEDFEGANEELRAANEELQSINEEYRSTAEELETSKEELQSINEELQTVNSELKFKLEGVSRINSDLQNLMAVTDIGTLFLDTALAIKRFNPSLADLFNITAADDGRSITDFTHRLDYPGFAEDARSVLRDLIPIEREVSGNGLWFLTRLRPYRTVDDRIDGVVVTFVDVTGRRTAEDALRASVDRSRLLMQELSHRVKNTLAVVQSMARMSFKNEAPRELAMESFAGRLQALSHAHEMLINSDWQGADITDLIRIQIPQNLSDTQISMVGPRVMLPSQLATPFGLIVHELMTNAMKYGGLSSPDGTVSLTWQLNGDAQDMLQFTWRETGGSSFKQPQKPGFGSQLIERSIPGATVSREFSGKGMVCTIEVSIRDLSTHNS